MNLFNTRTKVSIFYFLTSLFLLTISHLVYAQTIIIKPRTIISFPKTYNNVTLDLTNGSFIIQNNASLTINDSNIIGTISPSNPILFTVDGYGTLNMNNSQVTITAKGINPHPMTQALQYVIQTALGTVNLIGNSFSIDKSFTAGLLITTSNIPTKNFKLQNNTINNFHGVFYLLNNYNALITGNQLTKNSYGHIVITGQNAIITNNTISYSGNDHLGNAMDIIGSKNILINKNLLLTPTCHGIYVLSSDAVTIDNNLIFGGITYAMNVLSVPELLRDEGKVDQYVAQLITDLKINALASDNITISNNYMSQNRYGVAVSDVSHLTVQNNIFIQRFSDNTSRKFWTDNSILLKNITTLIWTNNLYKEAFTQAIDGSNAKSFTLVPFPQTGGVVL